MTNGYIDEKSNFKNHRPLTTRAASINSAGSVTRKIDKKINLGALSSTALKKDTLSTTSKEVKKNRLHSRSPSLS